MSLAYQLKPCVCVCVCVYVYNVFPKPTLKINNAITFLRTQGTYSEADSFLQ